MNATTSISALGCWQKALAIKPAWAINYATHERFRLPQLDGHVDMGGGAMSISRYFTEMLDPAMTWDDVAAMVREWGGQFCLKGIMSVEDAKRAVDIGCTGIVLSNHGGRQLDGSRSAFDQLAEIVDAVGDRIDVLIGVEEPDIRARRIMAIGHTGRALRGCAGLGARLASRRGCGSCHGPKTRGPGAGRTR